MTKTLTEQWKKKELKDGDYYVLNKAGDIVCDYYIEILGHFDSVLTENVKKVLAPVPSYDEYCNLVFQANKPKNPLSDVMMCYDTEREKKVVERLQEQLDEANKLLLDFCSEGECRFDHNGYCQEHDSCEGGYKCIQKDLKQYLKKWGVK